MTMRCIATIATITTTWTLYGTYVTLASFFKLPAIPPGLRGYLLAALIVGSLLAIQSSRRARQRDQAAAEALAHAVPAPPRYHPEPPPEREQPPRRLNGIDPETIAAARRLTHS
jgi:hypothetical protein